MRCVARFLKLPAGDRWLLVKALGVVTVVRLRLALMPFRPSAGGSSRPNPRNAGPSPRRIAWAVERAGNFFGRATCLARALAAGWLLRQHGFTSQISIGVDAGQPRNRQSNLIAHAWLELGGEILVGGPDIARYTSLLTWSN